MKMSKVRRYLFEMLKMLEKCFDQSTFLSSNSIFRFPNTIGAMFGTSSTLRLS